MKGSSTLLPIQQAQINIIICHHTSMRKGKIKNGDNIKCRWGCIETGSFSIAGGM